MTKTQLETALAACEEALKRNEYGSQAYRQANREKLKVLDKLKKLRAKHTKIF